MMIMYQQKTIMSQRVLDKQKTLDPFSQKKGTHSDYRSSITIIADFAGIEKKSKLKSNIPYDRPTIQCSKFHMLPGQFHLHMNLVYTCVVVIA